MVKNSFEEKNTVDKKYTILLGDIKNCIRGGARGKISLVHLQACNL
jgi:hypothetical protein